MTTVERRPRQFLAVWSDDGQSVKGSTYEESLFIDGAFWKNEITPQLPEAFAAYGEAFSFALQQQHNQLLAEKQAVDNQVKEFAKEIERLQGELTTATALAEKQIHILNEKCDSKDQELAASKKAHMDNLQALDVANRQLDQLKEQLDQLTRSA